MKEHQDAVPDQTPSAPNITNRDILSAWLEARRD
jgi:hypothetical protein